MLSKARAIALRQNPNVQKFLSLIAHSEGAGYRSIVHGGKNNTKIKDLSKHPQVTKRTKSGAYPSTAAGRYQFLYSTWKRFRDGLKLPDFSPESQDLAAIAQLAEVGAIEPILKGDIAKAIEKSRKVWASFPGAGYDQPERTLKSLLAFYNGVKVEQIATVATGATLSVGLVIGVLAFFF